MLSFRTEVRAMLTDRDFIIFLLLLAAVLVLNAFPIPPVPRLVLFILIVVAQAVFVVNGIRRSRR